MAPTPRDPPPRRLVNTVQAAALAGVSRRTIFKWLEAGKVEAVRTVGGQRRIYADSLFHAERKAPHR